jgi:hypothetical protein
MILLLGKFDNITNNELQNIVDCYQDYFIFKINNNITSLYLDTKILKYYLLNGLNIKYREYIFLFLKNYEYKSNYKLLDKLKYNNLDKYINNFSINDGINDAINDGINDGINNGINDCINDSINNEDLKNLETIVNLSCKIIQNKNKVQINDKNIIKLEYNFYANTDLFRFYLSKVNDKIFKFSGILLNYNDSIKNKILILLTLNILKNKMHIKKNNKKVVDNNIKKINLQIDTKCNLILTEKNNINTWMKLIKEYCPNTKIFVIYNKKNFKDIYYKSINKLDFLIVNFSLVSNKIYKDYLNKYNTKKFNFYDSIINSILDNSFNRNLENEYFFNFYLFNWNNIIYDNIEKIHKVDKNYLISYITTINTKYYIINKSNFENSLMDYIIKNNIYINDKKIIKYEDFQINLDNFYNFVKNELLVSNSNNNKKKLNIIYTKLELSNVEYCIYNKLFNTITDSYEKISKFLTLTYNYNFVYICLKDLDNVCKEYYNKLINNEEDKLKILNNFFKSKKDDESYNEFISKYFDINILFEKTMDDIKILQNEFKSNIKNYSLKLQYIINIIENYNENTYNCTLCMDKIEEYNFCIIICGHYFCNDCIRKYISEKENNFECPICRENFNYTNIYCLNDNLENLENLENLDNNNYKNGTKMNQLINKVLESTDKKIIILTQYRNIMIEIKKIFNNLDVINYNLFFKNSNINEKNKNLFNTNKNKCVLVCTNNDILNYNFINLSSVFFLDYAKIENNNDNIYNLIKNKFNDFNSIKLNFLYIKDTYEESIINNYINI